MFEHISEPESLFKVDTFEMPLSAVEDRLNFAIRSGSYRGGELELSKKELVVSANREVDLLDVAEKIVVDYLHEIQVFDFKIACRGKKRYMKQCSANHSFEVEYLYVVVHYPIKRIEI